MESSELRNSDQNQRGPINHCFEIILIGVESILLLNILFACLRSKKINKQEIDLVNMMQTLLFFLLGSILLRAIRFFVVCKYPNSRSLTQWHASVVFSFDFLFAFYLWKCEKMYYDYAPEVCNDDKFELCGSLFWMHIYGFMIIIKVGIIVLGIAIFILALVLTLCIFLCYDRSRVESAIANAHRVPLPSSIRDLLPKKKYDPKVFSHENECSICLVNYTLQDQITTLPCDPRHYYHSGCIMEWLKIHGKCPLCNKVITSEDIERQQKETIPQVLNRINSIESPKLTKEEELKHKQLAEADIEAFGSDGFGGPVKVQNEEDHSFHKLDMNYKL